MTRQVTEYLHMRPLDVGECEIHEWATAGLAARLVTAMRERHGKGGINACRSCLERARTDARFEIEARRP